MTVQTGIGDQGHAEEASDAEFDTIFRAEAPALLRFVRRHTRSPEDAQDIAQDTMLRFLKIARTTPVATPQAYLRTIAINLLRDRADQSAFKVATTSTPLIEGLDFEDEMDQHRHVAGRQELAEWEKILADLKPRTLEIFLLSRVDGFTYRQIANRFGMTVWNVHRHMRNAIAHVERNRRGRS